MATTPDRTTIKATIQELASKLVDNLVADPPTASKPFRRIVEGPTESTGFPRPFMAVYIKHTKLLGTTQNDKVVEVQMGLRVVTDVTAADPHDALLDLVGAVDDYFDSIVDSGVIEGAEGFDRRTWSFDYPSSTAAARVASAEALQTFVTKVEREQNRSPAT